MVTQEEVDAAVKHATDVMIRTGSSQSLETIAAQREYEELRTRYYIQRSPVGTHVPGVGGTIVIITPEMKAAEPTPPPETLTTTPTPTPPTHHAKPTTPPPTIDQVKTLQEDVLAKEAKLKQMLSMVPLQNVPLSETGYMTEEERTRGAVRWLYFQRPEQYAMVEKFYSEEYQPAVANYDARLALFQAVQTEAILSELSSYLSSVGISKSMSDKIMEAAKTNPDVLREVTTAASSPITIWYKTPRKVVPLELSRYPNLVALGVKERDIVKLKEPAPYERARSLRLSLQQDYLTRLEKLPFNKEFYEGTGFTSVKEAVLTTQAQNLSQLTGTPVTAAGLEEIFKTKAFGIDISLPKLPKSFSELSFGEAAERVAPLAIRFGIVYGGGLLFGAAAETFAPVAGGLVATAGKFDIFAKLAGYISPAVKTMWEVQKGAIMYAAPYVAQQAGLIAFTGIETYKARGMYEAGVPIPSIALSVGSDIATVGFFSMGFKKGYELGLPSPVKNVLIGKEKLFIKGEYVKSPTAETPFYETPSITYPEGAEAFYKRTGGLFSKLTNPYGQLPIEAGMVLPTGAISLPSGKVAEEWALVSSMRLEQVEQWARLQPFKLGVPLEKGTEIIDSRLIGVQALGDTQSIRYWAGVSAKNVEYTPFEGELFEPWTLTKTNLTTLKTSILVPKELIVAPSEGWAQLQMNISRTIYPAGVLYPERPIGVLDKEWFTTKMYDVGRAMDQITSAYITTPGQAVGGSFAKIQFELTPAKTFYDTFGGGGSLIYSMDKEGIAGFTRLGVQLGGKTPLSDSIIVAGGGGQIVSSGNMALVDWPPRQVVAPKLLESAEEMFSPFMAHPLAAAPALQRGVGIGANLGQFFGVGVLNLASQKAAQASRGLTAIAQKQFVGGSLGSTQVPISMVVPIATVIQAPTSAQIQASIQVPALAVPTINITTLMPPPLTPPPVLRPVIPILAFGNEATRGKRRYPTRRRQPRFYYEYLNPVRGLKLNLPKVKVPKEGASMFGLKTKRRKRK